jgi:hypothetical protein
MGKTFTARYKQRSTNLCIECGEKVTIVQVAKTKWTKQQGMPTGMLWRCDNGHLNRIRNHILETVKVG